MFVCPWCAGKFLTRDGLDFHWDETPDCKANRNVNSSSQKKYGDRLFEVDGTERAFDRTGEETLRRVEAKAGEATLEPEESRRPTLRRIIWED